MRRTTLALAAVALASSCANPLGAGVPECDPSQLSSSMIVQIQAVPDATYVPCIYGLLTGWDYYPVEARSGRAVYYLNSDRMGLFFLTVEVLPSCQPTGIPTAFEDEDITEVELFKDVEAESTVEIVLVPEGPAGATVARALDIDEELEELEIKDRAVVVEISSGGEATTDRINQAAGGGAHVIAISIRDAEEGTLTVRLAGTAATDELSVDNLGDAIDEIEDVETPPTYRGKWYFVFAGGCVVYTFNAEGPGVETIEDDVLIALGLFDAEALREVAREEGFDI